MFWLVITIIAAIIAGICVIGLIASTSSSDKAGFGVGLGLTVVIWIVLSVIFSIHTIGTREAGVVVSFSGKISDRPVTTGVVWVAPWNHIQTANIGLQREDFHLGTAAGSDTTNAAVSKDQQPIFADLTVNYQVEPKQIVNLYRTVGPNWKAILLDSRALQDFKEVTSQYTAAQITTERSALRADTKQRLTDEMRKYDIGIVDVFVTNLGYTQSYRDAVNAKNVQVQKSLQAQAKVSQATAEAHQIVALAQGNADAIRIKGEALRKNPSVLTLEAIDKLNPRAQVIICTGSGSGNCPSFLPNLATTGK